MLVCDRIVELHVVTKYESQIYPITPLLVYVVLVLVLELDVLIVYVPMPATTARLDSGIMTKSAGETGNNHA